MIVIVMGAPGAGKGTQTDLLARNIGLRKFSTGDALRRHVKAGTKIGEQAKELMAAGNLVPDAILMELVKEELEAHKKDVVVLDGFPRTLNQAKLLQELRDQKAVRAVFFIQVDRAELIKRLTGRRTCEKCGSTFHVDQSPPRSADVCDHCQGRLVQRPDDQIASANHRLTVFDKETSPTVEYYEALGLVRYVDGNKGVDVVYQELESKLKESIS